MYENIILIPYRNRKEHLDYFLEHSWKLIKEHLPNTKLVIIEQEEGKLFNRGKILNVGIKEYLDKTKYFITHDVDVNPKTHILKLYNTQISENKIFGIYNSPCITLGGIIKIHSNTIKEINGFPNDYWGWGVEDKALYNRAIFYKKEIEYTNYSNDKDIHEKFKVFNNVNDRVKDTTFNNKTYRDYNLFNTYNKEKQKSHIMSSGLNTLEYTIIERKSIDNEIEWIKVSI